MDITNQPNQPAENKPAKAGLRTSDYVLIGVIVVVVIIVGIALMTGNPTQPTEGRAPDFTATTFNGQEFSLRDFRGKVVVLNFWASWCGPCKEEAPALEASWQAYKDKGVQFIGIAYADNGPRSIEFLHDYGITYLNAPDLGTRISDMYAIQGVPETFIIDQDGNVAQFFFAGVTEEQLSEAIDNLLQG